jgi:hypothetical protein
MAGSAGLRRAARTALRATACRRRSAPQAGRSNLEVRTLPAPLRRASGTPRRNGFCMAGPAGLRRAARTALRAAACRRRSAPQAGRSNLELRTLPAPLRRRSMATPAGATVSVWLGRQDSNLRMPGSKPGALPLGDGPVTRSTPLPLCSAHTRCLTSRRPTTARCSGERLAELHHPAPPGLRLPLLCRSRGSRIGKQPEQAAPGSAEPRGNSERLQPAQRGIDGRMGPPHQRLEHVVQGSVSRGRDSLGGTVSCQFRGTEHRGSRHRDSRVDQQCPRRVGLDRHEPFTHPLGPGCAWPCTNTGTSAPSCSKPVLRQRGRR